MFYREKIFLLNASLTVLAGKPGSHMKKWEAFTNDVIEFICNTNKNCFFLLLGNYAKKKEKFIMDKKRIVWSLLKREPPTQKKLSPRQKELAQQHNMDPLVSHNSLFCCLCL